MQYVCTSASLTAPASCLRSFGLSAGPTKAKSLRASSAHARTAAFSSEEWRVMAWQRALERAEKSLQDHWAAFAKDSARSRTREPIISRLKALHLKQASKLSGSMSVLFSHTQSKQSQASPIGMRLPSPLVLCGTELKIHPDLPPQLPSSSHESPGKKSQGFKRHST